MRLERLVSFNKDKERCLISNSLSLQYPKFKLRLERLISLFKPIIRDKPSFVPRVFDIRFKVRFYKLGIVTNTVKRDSAQAAFK